MRHGKKHNHLGRTKSHRDALLKNMASSLILHKRITTTLAKAKELKKYVEPLLTRSKEDTTNNRRVIFSYLPSKEVVKELFSEISDKIADRPGGYTRIIKLGTRQGDNAEMCIIELVDFNETMLAAAQEKGAKTRRSRRSGKKSTEGGSTTTVAPAAALAIEDVTEEAEVVEQEAEVVEEVAVEAPVVAEETVAEEVAVVEEAPVVVEEVAAPSGDADDLKKIEGIGPKIASVLADAGVTTFAQLADITPEAIKEITTEAGVGATTDTWPQQAELARDGKWDELKTLQDELNGGRAE